MEDKEEYFVTKDIIIQEIQNIKPRFKDKTNVIPRKVATPLPPLNLSHTGNIWPKNAARDDKYIKSVKYSFAKRTGITPLVISNTNVRPAISLFPVLKTLVAPIFFEPIFLKSLFKKNLASIKPNGIEPDKYDKENIKSISIVTVN